MFIPIRGQYYWTTRELSDAEYATVIQGPGYTDGEYLLLTASTLCLVTEFVIVLFSADAVYWPAVVAAALMFPLLKAVRGFRTQRVERLVRTGVLFKGDAQPFHQLLLVWENMEMGEPVMMSSHAGLVNRYLQNPYIRPFSKQVNGCQAMSLEGMHALMQLQTFAEMTCQEILDVEARQARS